MGKMNRFVAEILKNKFVYVGFVIATYIVNYFNGLSPLRLDVTVSALLGSAVLYFFFVLWKVFKNRKLPVERRE